MQPRSANQFRKDNLSILLVDRDDSYRALDTVIHIKVETTVRPRYDYLP